MNLKKILFTCLILMILSVTAVSAADLDDINATDSIEPEDAIEPVTIDEEDTELQPIECWQKLFDFEHFSFSPF